MRIRPSKNKAAVESALANFAADEARNETTLPKRGPRGIVNARRLGLSKHRYRAKRTPKPFDRLAARRLMRLPRLMLTGEP